MRKIAPAAQLRVVMGSRVGSVREDERVRRFRAAAGTLLFLVIAPGVVAGLVPWLLTGWHATGVAVWLQVVGWVVLGIGAAVLLEAFARFVIEGVGSPAPAAPTEKLVVGGLYRYVRNPMYLAVAAVILGQALVLGRWVLVGYGLVFGLAVGSFVHWYEGTDASSPVRLGVRRLSRDRSWMVAALAAMRASDRRFPLPRRRPMSLRTEPSLMRCRADFSAVVRGFLCMPDGLSAGVVTISA
jgi:protein-S-isoprenylcysteine O-methyltransferase Ste14